MILIGIGIDFNPRLREGGDGCFNGSLEQFRISIHASAKEATLQIFWTHDGQENFNPRLREGGDFIQT